jgi:hypothetical protein
MGIFDWLTQIFRKRPKWPVQAPISHKEFNRVINEQLEKHRHESDDRAIYLAMKREAVSREC